MTFEDSECRPKRKRGVRTIPQGSDRSLYILCYDPKGEPIDLSTATEITARFGGLTDTVQLTLGDADIDVVAYNKARIKLLKAKTALLDPDVQDFEVWVDFGANDRRIAQVKKAIKVVAPLFT